MSYVGHHKFRAGRRKGQRNVRPKAPKRQSQQDARPKAHETGPRRCKAQRAKQQSHKDVRAKAPAIRVATRLQEEGKRQKRDFIHFRFLLTLALEVTMATGSKK